MVKCVYGFFLIFTLFTAKFLFAADSLNPTHWVTVGDYYADDDQVKPLSYISNDAGITWKLSATLPPPINAESISYLNDVFCNKKGQCTAVGLYTSANAPLSYISNDFGNNWCLPGSRHCSYATLPTAPEYATRTELISVVCDASNKTANCVAVGEYSAQEKNHPIIYLSKNSGVNWEPAIVPSVPDVFGGKLRTVSCQVNGKCMAAGEYNISATNTLPLIYLSNDFGETWCFPGSDECASAELPQISEGITTATLTSITCDKNNQTKKCAVVGQAVDENGVHHPLSYISKDNGYTWSKATVLPYGHKFSSVACQEKEKCIAVGEHNETGERRSLVYLSKDFGETWCLPGSAECLETTLPPEIEYNNFLTGVFCDTKNCNAVGSAATAGGPFLPLIYTSQDAGKNWDFANLPSPQPIQGRVIGITAAE